MRLLQRTRSVQFLLAFWYSTFVFGVLLLFGGSIYIYLQHFQEAQQDKTLQEEVTWISEIVDLERVRLKGDSLDSLSHDIEMRINEHFSISPRNYVVVLATTGGKVLFESDSRGSLVRTSVSLATPGLIMQTLNATQFGDLRVAARHIPPFLIYIGDPTHTATKDLVSIFSVLAPVMLIIAFASSWLMAAVILRPIRQISAMANKITAHNLNERIPERNVDDELGSLITTMNSMIARLQSSFEEMRLFSMNVAHELRTPLAILKGQSELALSHQPSTDEMHELITSYLEETIHMSRIIDGLLTLAKADGGQITLEFERVRLDEIIRELYEDATILAGSKELSLKLLEPSPTTVLGDSARLRQLFRILLTNALQYTDPRGGISIACECRDGNAFVSIEDTGIGIPPESINRIFDRFYRVDQARTRVKGGSGLGLALAKWIVEAHHGTISVQSREGHGSKFTVAIPLA